MKSYQILPIALVLVLSTACSKKTDALASSNRHYATVLPNMNELMAKDKRAYDAAIELINDGKVTEGRVELERLRKIGNMNTGEICLSLGRIYFEEGRYKESAEILEPIVIQSGGSSFQYLHQDLLKLEGPKGLQNFIDRNRDNKALFCGRSISDLNREGLTDEQAVAYMYTRVYDWDPKLADKAEVEWQKVLDHPLEKFEYYDEYVHFLTNVGRIKNDDDMLKVYEDLYRKASPELKEKIKKRYRINYPRIDAEAKP